MQLGELAGLKPSKPMRDVFGEALLNLARQNSKVVVLDGDLGNSTKAELVRQEFPERFLISASLKATWSALAPAWQPAG